MESAKPQYEDPAPLFESRNVELVEDTEATELSGQQNYDNDIRTKITHQESFGCGVIGSVRGVSYGTWKNDPACLVLFTFNFRSGKSALRIKSAEISVSFHTDSNTAATSPNDEPILRNFSPRKIFGIPHAEKRDWKYEISLQCNIPSISLAPTAMTGGSSSYTKDHRLQIIGQPWSDRKRQEPHQVLWTIREAEKTEYGIPDELNMGIVIGYMSPFQAIVEVSAKLGMGLPVCAPPWSKDAPLLFNTTTMKGEPMRTREFDKLGDEDWKIIAPYVEEWRVR
jgi:hypothetical protein